MSEPQNQLDYPENSVDLMKKYMVVKSNELIQKTRYSMTVQEQRIIMFLISKIKPDDEEFKTVRFSIKDFCYIAGIDYANGTNYINIKTALKKLADRSFWVTVNDGKTETIVRWIEKPYIHMNSGVIDVKMDELMKPYLLQLKGQYTQYELEYAILLKSQYSTRIYEILKSYQNLGSCTYDIQELKRKLYIINDNGKDSYERFTDFKKNVIERAVNEINACTDINIQYRFIKTSRKYTDVEFYVQSKNKAFLNSDNIDLSHEGFVSTTHEKKPKKELEKEILDTLMSKKEIPYEYTKDKRTMEMVVKILTDRNLVVEINGSSNTPEEQIYTIFKKALVNMCCAKRTMTINDEDVDSFMVIDMLNENLSIKNGYVDIYDVQISAIDNFTKAIKSKEIVSPNNYMRACIWSALNTKQLNLFDV